jgi:hypothetical protein
VRGATAWASAECLSANDEVLAYTLSLGDGFFVHQLAADAYAASHASGRPSSITVAFALIGLCLFAERGFSGRWVQLAHMQLAERRREWPRFEGPGEAPAMAVLDVLAAAPGPERDEAIRGWARAVWAAWEVEHERVRELVELVDEERLPRA